MKNSKTLSLAATGLALVAMNNTAALAKSSDAETLMFSDSDLTALDNVLYSGCEQPAHRDYHSVLAAYGDTAEDSFKFSGCGSAI